MCALELIRVFYLVWGEGPHYTSSPKTALLLFAAQFKVNCPLFLPSAIHQASSPYSIGSAMTDEQFKRGDDLSFPQITSTAVELFNSEMKKNIGQLGLDKKGRAF